MSGEAATDVLVAGAGPTGLLLAAELCRRQVDCQVIDSLEAPRHWDRATVVHPRSLEVFEAMGIVDRFLAAGVRQRAVRLHSDGDVLGEMDLGTCGSAYGFNLGLSEEVTESLLTDHLHAQGGAVCRGRRLVGLEHRPDAVVATIEHDGERRELAAGWLVGCDGLHSCTRELSGVAFEGHDIPEPWAVFDVTLDGWPDAFDVTFAYLDETPVILTALPGRRWRVYLRPSSPTTDLVHDAGRVIDRYRAGVTLVDVTNPTLFHCHTKLADRYRSGRVLLAGDAAHVCSPAQGHGMNSGLQDAFNLAWKLAVVCAGAAGPGLLDSYEAERRPVGLSITRSGDIAEQLERFADPADRAARDAGLRSAFADPGSRYHEVVAEAELDISYAGSPIVAGDGHEQLAAGERLPDTVPVQMRDGRARRLRQLIRGAGHTLFVLVGGSGPGDRVVGLVDELGEIVAESPLLDAVVVLSAGAGLPASMGRLEPSIAAELSIDDVTVLAARPDGHIGLRFDGVRIEPLRQYLRLLRA